MSSAFTGFVLLNEAKFDKEKFLKDLKEDWKVTLDLGGEDENKETQKIKLSIKKIEIEEEKREEREQIEKYSTSSSEE